MLNSREETRLLTELSVLELILKIIFVIKIRTEFKKISISFDITISASVNCVPMIE